jgi:ABC-type transporter Mla MlaB component
VAVVAPRGELDLVGTDALRRALLEACEAERLVVVDLAGVTFLDSAALGVIVGATKRMQRRDANLQIVNAEGSDLVIYRTDTSGRRWGKVSTLRVPGRSASKVWLDWSPQGVLGLGWRATASSGYLFYGAVSYDAGRTWTVHRLSKAESPASQGVWVAGDDTSAVWVTKDRFYATWGDWRTGSLQTFWGGFPLPRR